MRVNHQGILGNADSDSVALGWSLSFLVRFMLSPDQTFGSKDIHVVHIEPREGTEASESKNGNLHQFLSLFWNQTMQNKRQRLTSQSFMACSLDLLNVCLAQGHVAGITAPHTPLLSQCISQMPSFIQMITFGRSLAYSFGRLGYPLIHQHRFSLWSHSDLRDLMLFPRDSESHELGLNLL